MREHRPEALLRRAGTHPRGWTPDQRRTTSRSATRGHSASKTRVNALKASGERILLAVRSLQPGLNEVKSGNLVDCAAPDFAALNPGYGLNVPSPLPLRGGEKLTAP